MPVALIIPFIRLRFAEWHCSGRVVSVLEGGYGVPCCKFERNDLFLPKPLEGQPQRPSLDEKVVELSEMTRAKIGFFPEKDGSNADEMPTWLTKDLVRCAGEGFVECVELHCTSLREGARRFKLGGADEVMNLCTNGNGKSK